MSRDRLKRLPVTQMARGFRVAQACGMRARLLGLAFLPGLPERHALLLPRCSSVHTFGMRFELDLVFLDRRGEALRVVRGIGPRRVSRCSGARSVLETRAGEADLLLEALEAAAGCAAP